MCIRDRSQTAGVLPINIREMNIDVLCFTGHKGLMGPQGTGGLYVGERADLSLIHISQIAMRQTQKVIVKPKNPALLVAPQVKCIHPL